MRQRKSYDFYLILATAFVLFIISIICIYGLFYFKLAQIHQMPLDMKIGYMNRMNSIITPFVICLILLLGICVPKRLLPTGWLHRFTLILAVLVTFLSLYFRIKTGLLFVLVVALFLQFVVLGMALAGGKLLSFETKGYWQRVGSSLVHLGLILFILDLFFYEKQTLHLILFWVTTLASVLGMVFCFYSRGFSRLIKKKQSIYNGK